MWKKYSQIWRKFYRFYARRRALARAYALC